jgi:methylated-DNA-[protein]-cysteine S-methyltransferase
MNEIVRWCRIETPLGTVRIVARGHAIAGVWFDGQKYDAVPDAAWHESPNDPLLRDAARQLKEYFAGRRARFDLALAPQGTAFQQSVWRAIAKVPAGRTASYGDLARRIGRPSAVRAVGAAVGRNPLSVVVPCHRIVGSDGSLTGYAGGLERKRLLLALERVEVDAAQGAIAAGSDHSA